MLPFRLSVRLQLELVQNGNYKTNNSNTITIKNKQIHKELRDWELPVLTLRPMLLKTVHS